MYKILAISLISTSVSANGLYIDLGIGSLLDNAAPEITLDNPIGKFGIGYQSDNGITIEYEHFSGIFDNEKGGGADVLWINKRFYFE